MDERTQGRDERHRRIMVRLLAVIAIVLVGAALQATYVASMPLAFAFFLTLLVRPIQTAVNRRLPEPWHWVGTLAAMLSFLVILVALAGAIWLAIELASSRIPEYVDRFRGYYAQAVSWAREHNLPISQASLESARAGDRVVAMVTAGVTSIWSVGALIVLILFLVLLMLLEFDQWRAKIGSALHHRSTAITLDAVDALASRLRRYLLIRTVTSVVSGVSAALWLWLMGVEFAYVWGLLTFALNYIPNVGSILSTILPSIMAFVQFGWAWGLATVGGLVAIEQVIGNFIDPRLQGRYLEISPVVVLAALLIWGWAWGLAGLLVAVPMTMTILIVCAHFPALEPVALLLSRKAGRRETLDRLTGGD